MHERGDEVGDGDFAVRGAEFGAVDRDAVRAVQVRAAVGAERRDGRVPGAGALHRSRQDADLIHFYILINYR